MTFLEDLHDMDITWRGVKPVVATSAGILLPKCRNLSGWRLGNRTGIESHARDQQGKGYSHVTLATRNDKEHVQLPSSFRQPHSVHSLPDLPHPAHITSSQSPPSLSSPITASTFHSRLKTHLFHKSFPP